jgi:hypothetical protein
MRAGRRFRERGEHVEQNVRMCRRYGASGNVPHAAQKATVRRARRTDYGKILDDADALVRP